MRRWGTVTELEAVDLSEVVVTGARFEITGVEPGGQRPNRSRSKAP